MMASHRDYLCLAAIRKSFGSFTAVDNFTLSVAKGERIALLGPSGCGKTTTLNIIAGFLKPDGGSIQVSNRDITELPAHRRNTGMVFQQYALFPHLTVAQNVAFGLKMRRVPKGEASVRVNDALALVQLLGFENRFPRELSGGQQQRVAVARALVISPDILLLDEPLSNLDAKLRREMRTEMLRLLDAVNLTTILVTHDQEEALALANRIVVMNHGRIEQIGSPQDIFERPSTTFVARFIGDPNVLSGTVVEVRRNSVICDIGSKFRFEGIGHGTLLQGAKVDVLIRGERIKLTPSASSSANSVPIAIERSVYLGNHIRHVLSAHEQTLVAIETNNGRETSDQVAEARYAEWSTQDTLVFEVRE